jgi:DNA-binding transcriptional ArsR family regulator
MAALRRQGREIAPRTPCRAQFEALTPADNYVNNRLHIMSKIAAKTDPFRAIADPTRRAILDRLRAGPANAGTLAADFRSSRPAVSKHLRVLREARLVVDTKLGRERLYTVNPAPLQSVAGWLEGYRAFWQASLQRLKRNLEEK